MKTAALGRRWRESVSGAEETGDVRRGAHGDVYHRAGKWWQARAVVEHSASFQSKAAAKRAVERWLARGVSRDGKGRVK